MGAQNEVINELTTIRDYLRWGMTQFNAANLSFAHGTDNAWDEALALVRYALHLPIDCDSEIADATLTTTERKTILSLFEIRIKERIPAAYITNQAYFMQMPFYVDERVIIPRSPIGELITHHFEPWLNHEPTNILDLCTGSGCIAIGLAKTFPHAKVTAVDISQDALEVAKKNVDTHHVDIELVQSDLFNNLKPQQFDLIVSNPPYVDPTDLAEASPEHRHEPELALAGGGEDGLEIVDRILTNASQYLTDNGLLVVEVGGTANATLDRYPHLPFIWPEFERGGEGVFLLTAEDLQRV